VKNQLSQWYWLILVVILLTACPIIHGDPTYGVTVFVQDTTATPIEGAQMQIKIENQSDIFLEGTTDKTGCAVDTRLATGGINFTLLVTLNGYKDAQITYLGDNGRDFFTVTLVSDSDSASSTFERFTPTGNEGFSKCPNS
jgi:hypothetical protein